MTERMKKIRYIMDIYGITPKELGEVIGVSHQTIWNLLNGVSNTQNHIILMEYHLGISDLPPRYIDSVKADKNRKNAVNALRYLNDNDLV